MHAKNNSGIATRLAKYLVIAAGAISTSEYTRAHTRTHEQVHQTNKNTITHEDTNTITHTRRQVHAKSNSVIAARLAKYIAIVADAISTTDLAYSKVHSQTQNTHALSHNHKHTYTHAHTHWELTTKNE